MKNEKIHLLIHCKITGTVLKKIAYCGKSMMRKMNRSIIKKETTCQNCLINRNLCEGCHWLSGTNRCWFLNETDWYFHSEKIGECSNFISKEEGKKKYANSGFERTWRDKEDTRIANKRTHADRMNSYNHGYGYTDS